MTMMEILLDLLDNISTEETTYTYSFTATAERQMLLLANGNIL